jgi:hypothetical protein
MADAPQVSFTPEQMKIVQGLIAQANPPAPFNPYPAELGTAPMSDVSTPAWDGVKAPESKDQPRSLAAAIDQKRLDSLNPNSQIHPSQPKQLYALPTAQELMVRALVRNPTADFAQLPEKALQNPVSGYINDTTNILKPDVAQAAQKVAQMLGKQQRIAGMAPGSQQALPSVL